MPHCPACHQINPDQARYCMQCGTPLPPPKHPTHTNEKPVPRFDVLALTLMGSILLTLALSWLFHLPIFILGAFLPFFWRRRKPR